jgi:flagellar motor protein MotB
MARRKKQDEEKPADGFSLLFTTLSLIILAFFIFLKTLSTPDDNRERRAIASIRRTFAWVSLGGIYANESNEEVSSLSISQQEQSFRSLEQELIEIVRRLSLGATDEIRVTTNEREARISLSQNIIFRPGIIAINPRSFAVLDRISEFLTAVDREVLVEGHTDPAGDSVNWELSSLRAAAVARYLGESMGGRDERIRCRGLAHYYPPGVEDFELRRVEIVVLNSGGEG